MQKGGGGQAPARPHGTAVPFSWREQPKHGAGQYKAGKGALPEPSAKLKR